MTALQKPLKITGPMRMVIPMLAEMWITRPYPLDITTFTGTIERAVGNFLAVLIGKSAPDPEKALVEEDGVVVRFEPPVIRRHQACLSCPGSRYGARVTMIRPNGRTIRLSSEALANRTRARKRDLHSLTWEQNIETLHNSLDSDPARHAIARALFSKSTCRVGYLVAVAQLGGYKDRFASLISGVETKTTETEPRFGNLGQANPQRM